MILYHLISFVFVLMDFCETKASLQNYGYGKNFKYRKKVLFPKLVSIEYPAFKEFDDYGHLVGFSYHLPSKSYAIFQLPSSSITTNPITIPTHHPPNSINAFNHPVLPPQAPVPETSNLNEGNVILQTEAFLNEYEPSYPSLHMDDIPEIKLENAIDTPDNPRIPPTPQRGHDPNLLYLPPLMSPEIIHGIREFPEIELQKVPSLGETNTMVVGPPIETTIQEVEDVDLKFFDAVPELEKLSK